jgi:hypothetical protein
LFFRKFSEFLVIAGRDGQHLGTCHEADDAVVGHLLDNEISKLEGHAAWLWVDDPDKGYSSNHESEPPRELTLNWSWPA